MNWFVNMLIEWQEGTDKSWVERVLWIDPSSSDMVAIDIVDKQALPIWQKRTDVEAALAAKKARALEVDPYTYLLRPEDTIPKRHRKHRDEAWEVIAPLVESGVDIFVPSKRGRLVVEAVKRTGRIKKTIYLYLRRYWQRGQTRNALLPNFDRCGGRGKEKTSSGRKRGRPSRLAKVTGQPTGVNVDDGIKERFQRGIKRFYEKRTGMSLRRAFQLTLENFFHKGYELRGGALVPILPPREELPTFDQFRYWYEKERNPVQTITSRYGERQFNANHRGVLGDSTLMAFGPGTLYQFDATIGDIYLVSSLDRSRIIGRPVISTVIDVFSRLITGIGVGLEGPSWLSAMLALENGTADKVAFCAEYGISITEDEWPSHHLPEAILADRGELEGYDADSLVNALDIKVSNTPPYRADWKGIVERNFRLSNDKVIRWLPGAVYKKRERGDQDYRLDACLTLHEFGQLMIRCVLHHNNHHRMAWYRMDKFMITDHVEPYPLDLWNWGVQNRVGHLRTMAQDIVRLNLLPTKEAVITRSGIRFQGLDYTCELAMQENWFVKARERGSWKIPVAYDPRKLDIVYLRLDGGRRVEPCYLLDRDKVFQGCDWYESLDYLGLQKQAEQSAITRQQQVEAEFHAQIERIVGPAREQAEQARRGQSKSSRLRGIRGNRQVERERERQDKVWLLAREETISTQTEGEDVQVDQSKETEQEYVPPSQPIDQLRKLRQEKLNNER